MRYNFVFDDVNEALPNLLNSILLQGIDQPSRNGSTKELAHVGITLDKPWRREILLPERKANLAAQIAETAWVLAGRNDIEWLQNYLPRASDFSDDGHTWRAGYGPRMRRWWNGDGHDKHDQLHEVIELLKADHDTRRAVISLFDPAEDFVSSKDIPCNNWLHFLIRNEKLDLHVVIRSNDVVWGWSGINQFEWSVLQEVVAGLVGVQVGALHFSISSLHLYEQHYDRARKIVNAQANDHTPDSPWFDAQFCNGDLEGFDHMLTHFFQVEELIRLGHTEVDDLVTLFPEPMLKSWLQVLQWYWGQLSAESLPWRQYRAAIAGVKPKVREVKPGFVEFVTSLHDEKHAAYGDSWKKRGELFSIIPNVARKIDRLEIGGNTTDESQFDTAVDLVVYLAKYRFWLSDYIGSPVPLDAMSVQEVYEAKGRYSDTTPPVNALIKHVYAKRETWKTDEAIAQLCEEFERLTGLVEEKIPERYYHVDRMLLTAVALAGNLWQTH